MKLKNSFKNVILFSCCLFVFMAFSQNKESKFWSSSKEALKEMEQIRKLIKAPKFKNKEYLITNFGAKGDGVTKNTEAFKKAIEACNAAGGGRVVVPVGNFLTGPIYLKSNVNLVVNEGATITFSQDTKDYPIVLTRWEGMDCMNYSPQIYAHNEKNIAIT
ncbi:MAG TPA: glycosyl hydrolase family 28-related protein, partial [Flavobacterium sp.]|nr:glycosyl hydrolase family 28-related protein [Flavobacterium sp.]